MARSMERGTADDSVTTVRPGRLTREPARKSMLRILVPLLLSLSLAACSSTESRTEAERIVDRAIERHGGSRYTSSRISFRFRGIPFVVEQNRGMFEYTRTYSDTSGSIVEVLSNDGFVRTANGEPYEMTEREFNIWTEAVNSVVYFALLPYKLNDPAVVKRSLGQEVVEGRTYDRVEVTFQPEGGGRDHDDRFVFWFEAETSEMDYLAYYYTKRGTSRFRKAVNAREVGGIRFADYMNYRADSLSSEVELAARAYESGKLSLLSEVVLDSLRVESL